MPHSSDREYAERAIPQYERAVEQAGGEPVRIPLDQTPSEVMKLIERCDGVLLPGSNADVDPSKFGAARSPRTAAADPRRDTVDELLLQDAYNMRKPVLGICYGLQSLNVYRTGSLIQHIPDFLPEELRNRVNHEAGKKVAIAHAVEIDKDSKLAEIVNTKDGESSAPKATNRVMPVNSSHHQSAEALEGTAPDHFVLAVQWHPERSVDEDEPSRAIFRALIKAAEARHKQLIGEFEGVK
jgi:putative glutamine amidotransferase